MLISVRIAISSLIFAVGCSYSPAQNGGDDVPTDGTNPDSDGSTVTTEVCFGTSPFRVCVDPAPTNTVDLSTQPSNVLDTTASSGDPLCLTTPPASWTNGGQTDACIVVAQDITLDSGTLDVDGDRPLVLVASNSLTIAGTIDAASHVAGDKGPNASPASCGANNNGTTDSNKGGGGAGGSLAGTGGIGGTGNNNGGATATGGTPEGAGTAPFDVIRGGCRGGDGAKGDGTTVSGGLGGGAVVLLGGAVMISGIVNVAGGGGQGGTTSRGGGGGGGAGGMIVIDGTSIAVSGTLLATGGGGGGGADGNTPGGPGNDPDPFAPTTAAAGGSKGGGAGGIGGAGGTSSDGNAGNTADDGGGGGGGSVGAIRVLTGTPPSTGNIVPAATN